MNKTKVSMLKSSFIFLLILGVVPIFHYTTSFNIGTREIGFGYFRNPNLKIAKISGKIHIDNNWSSAVSAGICTGNGSYSDPYVIEDFLIDASGEGSGIWIENSNFYFKIENCTSYNSGGYRGGIRLTNVSNSLLINNTYFSNEFGIYLQNCINNTIINNTINFNTEGIRITFSHNNTVSGNVASNNSYVGISCWDSNNNTITANTANSNYWAGISINYCALNTISDNIIEHTLFTGIYFDESYDNIVSGNIITDGGLTIEGSNIKYYSHNIDTTNVLNGKPLYYYIDRDNLGPDDFINGGQVFLVNCSNSLISNLTITNSIVGILLYHCISANVLQNSLDDNARGIALRYSNDSIISENIANNNYNDGVFLGEHSEYNVIQKNIVNYNRYRGIYLWAGSNHNTIIGNIVSHNDEDGISLFWSSNNIITNNTVISNERGIYLDNSDNNIIYLNCFSNILNVYDESLDNQWDNGTVGNFWSDYLGEDSNNDGIGDNPYNIYGTSGGQDEFPLIKCHKPNVNPNNIKPKILGFNIFVILGIISFILLFLRKKSK